MRNHALIIEPCNEIREEIKDRLISINHTFDLISTQVEAREYLHSRCVDYSYIILSLSIPVRDNRPAKTIYGLNLLDEIRKELTDKPLPVVVTVDQCHSNTALKLAHKGLFSAVKPFEDDSLEEAIISALASKPVIADTITPENKNSESIQQVKDDELDCDSKPESENTPAINTSETQPESKYPTILEMVFYDSHVELFGMPVCSGRTTLLRRILEILKERYNSGSFKAYGSHDLEVLAECASGQQGITNCIAKFRKNISSLLEKQGIFDFDSIIINHAQHGYRLHENIRIVNKISSSKKKKKHIDSLAGLSESRQELLRYLLEIPSASRKQIEGKFNLSETTAGQYLTEFKEMGLIATIGKGRNTRWKAAEQ